MIKKSYAALLVAAALTTACSPKIYPLVDWPGKTVVADGKMNEWPNPLRYYDDKSKISYAIANDAQNLYLCLKIVNPAVQAKVMRGGVEFRVDTLGESRFPVSFKFPVKSEPLIPPINNPDVDVKSLSMLQPNADPTIRHQSVKKMREAELAGFSPYLNGFINLESSKCGISAAIDVDKSGVMVYEAIIPFSTFYKERLVAADAQRVFNFSIIVKGVERAEKKMEGNRPEGGMGRRGMDGGFPGRGGSRRGFGGQTNGTIENKMHGGVSMTSPADGVDFSSTSKIEQKMRLSFK